MVNIYREYINIYTYIPTWGKHFHTYFMHMVYYPFHKLYIEGDRYDEYDDYPIDKFRSLIGVTVGWTLLHYSFLFRESATAFSVLAQLRKAGEKIGINAIKYGSAGGSVMLNAVRTSGNMVEQSPAFLILLWLHGIFISPSSASWHGWLWLFFRSIYPQVFGTIPYIFF